MCGDYMTINIKMYESKYFTDLSEILKNVYDSDIKQEILEKKYIDNTHNIILAIDELTDSVVGCAFIEMQDDFVRPRHSIFITYVAVDEDYRKHGIGKKLFSFIETYAKQNAVDAIELTSADFRTGAHSFYKTLGFSEKKTTVFIKDKF